MGDGRSWGYAQAGAAIANFHDDAIRPSHIPWTKARARAGGFFQHIGHSKIMHVREQVRAAGASVFRSLSPLLAYIARSAYDLVHSENASEYELHSYCISREREREGRRGERKRFSLCSTPLLLHKLLYIGPV